MRDLMTPRITRRRFLRISGSVTAGLILAMYLPTPGRSVFAQGNEEPDPDLFLRIAPDGTVTVLVARQEMGQGVRTALPMILLEELDADWSRVRVEQMDSVLRVNMGTGGSHSVESSWDLLRHAGAAARAMLVASAAERWGVAASACRTADGTVYGPGGRSVGYGEVAAEAATQEPPDDPPLKDPGEFTIIGTEMPRVDGRDIVTGQAIYGQDVRFPGMKFASL